MTMTMTVTVTDVYFMNIPIGSVNTDTPAIMKYCMEDLLLQREQICIRTTREVDSHLGP